MCVGSIGYLRHTIQSMPAHLSRGPCGKCPQITCTCAKLEKRISSKCSSCGCPCRGQCEPVIALLKDATDNLRRDADAMDKGEAASLHGLRRRLLEAEERLRRADREVHELRFEASALHEHLAQRSGGSILDGVTAGAIAEDSDDHRMSEQICTAALEESRRAGTEAASRADAEAATSRLGTVGIESAAFSELSEAHDDAAAGKRYNVWNLGSWLEQLGVGALLANVLLARLRRHTGGGAPSTERSFARQLGQLGSKAHVVALLREAPLHEILADAIWRGADALATDARTSSQLPVLPPSCDGSDGSVATLGFARSGARACHGGLTSLLDAAAANVPAPLRAALRDDAGGVATGGDGTTVDGGAVIASLRREHTEAADARRRFTGGGYGLATTSETEYWFVVAPDKGLRHLELSAWPREATQPDAPTLEAARTAHPHAKGADFLRRPQPLREYDAKLREVNTRLVERQSPPISRAELIAARLLTSPMRTKYNATLRALAAPTREARAAHVALCGGGSTDETGGVNYYPTTLLLLDSALRKLAKLAAPTTLYRSVPGCVLPQPFWRPDARGVRGAVEAGVLSATPSQSLAAGHAARQLGGRQCVTLALHAADGAAAADLAWLSQYPAEGECAFPPLTRMLVLRGHVDGSAHVVDLLVSPASESTPEPASTPTGAPTGSGGARRVVDIVAELRARGGTGFDEEHSRVAAEVARAKAAGLPVASREFTLVSAHGHARARRCRVVLIDAKRQRWAADDVNPFGVPLRDMADGIATLTVSAEGHAEKAVRFLCLGGQARDETTEVALEPEYDGNARPPPVMALVPTGGEEFGD